MSKFAPHGGQKSNPRATSSTICQKCLRTGSSPFFLFFPSLANRPPDQPLKHLTGHFTYECKATRPYVSRPSRTAQLENPRVLAKLKADGKPSVDVPEEFKNKFVLCLLFFFLFLGRVCV
jgi:hypothetical protein